MDGGAEFWTVALLIVAALAYGFFNGFSDAAHSIASVVSTGALRPQQAVAFAALFQAAAVLVFPLGVALTVGGLVGPAGLDAGVVASALAATALWMSVSMYHGLPPSSTHALFGGLVGAALAKSGAGALDAGAVAKTLAGVLLAPALALVLGSLLMLGVFWWGRRRSPLRVDRAFRRAQLASAALHALARGGNGAQKTVGVIWLLLLGAGDAGAEGPPGWAAWSGYLALALGTLFGGWRVVRTMGQRLTKLKPVHGFCAEAGAAAALVAATLLGVPVSTTHATTAAIVGVGSKRHASAVRWGVSRPRLWAWALTIPAAALLGAAAHAAGRWFTG